LSKSRDLVILAAKGRCVVDPDVFADLVEEALESLPEEFKDALENVQIDVALWPERQDLLDAGLGSRNRYGLLGLYHGVPLPHRHVEYVAPPDHITIYQKPIEAAAGSSEDAIKEQVRRTVIHEIAHYYGIDDDRLEELDAY
jgi:predicted Zn-dependent protease with MMP-like domain